MMSLEQTQAQYECDIYREPCGCPQCDARVQAGHSQCEQSPEYMLAMERAGLVVRSCDDNVWHWYIASGRI